MKIIISDFINENFTTAEDYKREDRKFREALGLIADKISANVENKPIVLISGPSGSGKTTTANVIKELLYEKGHNSYVISLDNYFKTVLPEEAGVVDLESPTRIKSDLLSENIRKIMNLEETVLPRFDFVGKRSVLSGDKIKRQKGEIVIFEGIHALNESVIPIDKKSAVKLYVSVRTRVKCGDELIHPKYVRLLRRMSRDSVYRGRDISETLGYFKSVEKGEELYVAPFKSEADFSVDTFIPYEPKIYRKVLWDKLNVLTEKTSDNTAELLVKFLSFMENGNPDYVVKTSIIKEFIGNF